MAYSTVFTYILWLTLGWFGVHHLYLKRDRHAFVWLWTLGGGLGIGWLTEVLRLPRYVREANLESQYASGELLFPAEKISSEPVKQPPFRMRRFLGEVVFGCTVGGIALASVPQEIGDACHYLSAFVAPAGVAIGVHTVANIGNEQCDLIVCMLLSYVMLPFLVFLSPEQSLNVLTKGVLATAIVISYNFKAGDGALKKDKPSLVFSIRKFWSDRAKRFRTTRPLKRRICLRMIKFGICSALLAALTLSALWSNAYIKTDYGESIRLKTAVENFFKSPAWTAFRETGWKIIHRTWEGGIDNFFIEFFAAFDPEGELNAYKILNLTTSASEKEISDRYRDLAKKFHPDRFVNSKGDERNNIENRFIEIQQAYERISTIKSKRIRKNKRNEL